MRISAPLALNQVEANRTSRPWNGDASQLAKPCADNPYRQEVDIPKSGQ